MKKSADGIFEKSARPLRCVSCGERGVVAIPARTERARDLKVICRTCNGEIMQRLAAHCPDCTKSFIGKGDPDRRESESGTSIARVTMRLANSRANDAYYVHTLSMLRLDRPRTVTQPDSETRMLAELLPKDRRPDTGVSGTVTLLEDLLKRLREAMASGDRKEQARLQIEIAAAATAADSNSQATGAEPVKAAAPDVFKAVDEALAFRTTVTSRDAEVVAANTQGATGLLGAQIAKYRQALGIKQLLLVEDLPIIAAAFGYTRRSFEPTYDEESLGARNLPTRLRPFYSLDRKAALRLNRLDLEGTVPILAREGEHEGIFFSLDPGRVAQWIGANGIGGPSRPEEIVPFILERLEPVDRYYDQIWKLPLRRMVYGLVHSLSHVAMRVLSRLAGLERTSIGEFVFLPLLGAVVYANGNGSKLGGMETIVKDGLLELLEGLQQEGMECLYDPDCLDRRGACHGCIHSPEISCRVFNHGLSRSFLSGGHRPWLDPGQRCRLGRILGMTTRSYAEAVERVGVIVKCCGSPHMIQAASRGGASFA
jgi:hypothetical protein